MVRGLAGAVPTKSVCIFGCEAVQLCLFPNPGRDFRNARTAGYAQYQETSMHVKRMLSQSITSVEVIVVVQANTTNKPQVRTYLYLSCIKVLSRARRSSRMEPNSIWRFTSQCDGLSARCPVLLECLNVRMILVWCVRYVTTQRVCMPICCRGTSWQASCDKPSMRQGNDWETFYARFTNSRSRRLSSHGVFLGCSWVLC
jgi:hypothetical protein